jgi:hypothetical protein
MTIGRGCIAKRNKTANIPIKVEEPGLLMAPRDIANKNRAIIVRITAG